MRWKIIILLLFISIYGYSQTSTGWYSPTANGIDSAEWTYNTTGAYADGGTKHYTCPYCSSTEYPRTHTWYNYGFPEIPAGSTIDSIGIRLDVDCSSGYSTNLVVECSYDGGVHYTANGDYVTVSSAVESSKYIYSLFGRVWDASEFTNSNFRVKVRADGQTTLDPYVTELDWIPVNIYYTPSSGTGECATARWLFENDWTDEEGDYDLSLTGTPVFASSPAAVQGVYSADFYTGRSSNNSAYVNIDMSDTTWVIAFSVYFNHVDGSGLDAYVLDNRVDADSGFCISIDVAANRVEESRKDGATEMATSTPITPGTWNHVVIVYNNINKFSDTVFIYINGILSNSAQAPLASYEGGSSGPLNIGQPYTGYTGYGIYLDNVQLYHWKPTTAQIQSLYVNRENGDFEICSGGDEPTIYQGYDLVSIGGYDFNWYYIAGTNHAVNGPVYIPDNPAYSPYVDLGHYQIGLVPSDAEEGDYAVELNFNRNWRDRDGDGACDFAKTGGSNYFDIENGIIVLTADNPPPGIHTIEYAVTDDIFYDTASVDITVYPSAACKYIDLDAVTNGSGTRASPYNNLSFTYESGYCYLFKRGTNITISSYELITANNVTLGAYGEGVRPVIQNTGDYGNSIGAIHMSSRTNVTIRDIHIYDVGKTCIALLSTAGVNYNINLDNCLFEGIGTSTDGTYYGLLLDDVVGGSLRNCEIWGILTDGVHSFGMRGTSTSDRYLVEANYIHNINTGGHNQNGDCIDFGSQNNRYCHIIYNLFSRENTEYKHCLLYGMINTYQGIDCGTIIEYNRCQGYTGTTSYPQNGISLYGVYGVICRYNEIYNVNAFGIFTPDAGIVESGQYTEGGNRDLHIYGNLLAHVGLTAFWLNGNCDSTEIYNNTVYEFGEAYSSYLVEYGVYIAAGCNGVKIKNNIFYTSSEYYAAGVDGSVTAGDEDYNYFYPDGGDYTPYTHSVEGDPEFVSGYWHYYELNANSNAYHDGTDLSITYDIWGDQYDSSTPSVGCKEYIP